MTWDIILTVVVIGGVGVSIGALISSIVIYRREMRAREQRKRRSKEFAERLRQSKQ